MDTKLVKSVQALVETLDMELISSLSVETQIKVNCKDAETAEKLASRLMFGLLCFEKEVGVEMKRTNNTFIVSTSSFSVFFIPKPKRQD